MAVIEKLRNRSLPSLAHPRAEPSHGRLGYVPALDGLRAVAITLVAVYHAVMPAHFGGAGGVDVFFVLSGFLITTLLVQEREGTGRVSFRRFYTRRILRLYPPLLLMLAVVAIPIAVSMGVGTALGGSALSLFYLMPVGAESGSTTLSPYEHTWSLGVEEWFYLVWPPLLVLLLRARRRWAPIVATGATVVLAGAAFAAEAASGEVSFILRACGLMAGSALALVLDHSSRSRSPFTLGRWAGLLGLGFLGLSVVRSSVEPFSTIDVLTADLGTLLLVLAIMRGRQGFLHRALSVRPVCYVGRISYEIYLWHYPVLSFLGVLNKSDWLEVGWLALPISVVLAVLAHRVTQPLAAWLRSRTAARIRA